MAEKPTVTIADLKRLGAEEMRPDLLIAEEVDDYAIGALVVLRGLRRGDKLKVLRRMRKIVGK